MEFDFRLYQALMVIEFFLLPLLQGALLSYFSQKNASQLLRTILQQVLKLEIV